eukprot:gene22456-63088_t
MSERTSRDALRQEVQILRARVHSPPAAFPPPASPPRRDVCTPPPHAPAAPATAAPAVVTVEAPEKPECEGRYVLTSGACNGMSLYASGPRRLYSTEAGFWMITLQPDGPQRAVG